MAGHRSRRSGDWPWRDWGGQRVVRGHLKQWEWVLGAECRQKTGRVEAGGAAKGIRQKHPEVGGADQGGG